jgi:hypothetical protein
MVTLPLPGELSEEGYGGLLMRRGYAKIVARRTPPLKAWDG